MIRISLTEPALKGPVIAVCGEDAVWTVESGGVNPGEIQDFLNAAYGVEWEPPAGTYSPRPSELRVKAVLERFRGRILDTDAREPDPEVDY